MTRYGWDGIGWSIVMRPAARAPYFFPTVRARYSRI